MNSEFYIEHISEELNGAKQYIKYALELKGSNPSWSKMFVEMSSAELQHAEHLHKMYTEHYSSISGAYKSIPAYLTEMHDKIESVYTECSAHVRALHEMYNR